MKPFKTIELGTHKVKINNVEVKAIVTAKCYDNLSFDVRDYDDLKEQKRIEKQVLSGDFTPTSIVVEACVDGVEGVDSCGGFLINSEKHITDAIKDQDMIKMALADLETNVIERSKTLSKYL